MMAKRIAAAVVAITILVVVLLGDCLLKVDIFLNLALFVSTILCMLEFYRMCKAAGQTPFRGFGVVSSGLLVVLHWLSLPGTMERLGVAGGWPMRLRVEFVPLGLLIAVLGAFWLQATKRDNAKAFESISVTLLGALYVWFLPAFLVRIRHLGADGRLGGQDWIGIGTWLLVACIAVSKASDVGAFFTGSYLGKRKLITRISPRKTWEGAAGGLVAGTVMAVAIGRLALPESINVWAWIVFGILVGGLGQFGDLAESLLKRSGGIKDAGSMVPGFGGVLDLMDSLFISAPVAYFISVFMLGGGS